MLSARNQAHPSAGGTLMMIRRQFTANASASVLRESRRRWCSLPGDMRKLPAVLFTLACLMLTGSHYDLRVHAQTSARPQLTVKPVQDFEINGLGDNAS